MRVRPVSVLSICVTFTGMLAIISLVAILVGSLPVAIAAAASTNAEAVETHGNALLHQRGDAGGSDIQL